jgi:hypothetical protein
MGALQQSQLAGNKTMACHLHTGIFSVSQIQNKLHVAQQKLLEPHTSELLKFTYYLRVCCAMIQSINWVEQQAKAETYQTLRYAELLKALMVHDPNWWQQCYVSPMGLLQSTDPTVSQLLKPIEEVHIMVESTIAPPSPVWKITPVQLATRVYA